MKKLKYICLFVLSISLFACGGETKSTEGETTESNTESSSTDFKGMELVELSQYGIDASIYIADATKGKQDLRLTDQESLEIEVGKRYGVEIVAYGLTVAEKKEELAGDLVYEIEYIEDSPNKIVYKKTIKDNEVEPEVHFLLTTELNDEPYTVQSLNKVYNEKAIQKMITSAESLTAKKPA